MEKIEFQGLTNNLRIEDEKIIKTSKMFTQKYLNRKNEIKLYKFLEQFPNNYFVIPFEYNLSDDQFESKINILINSNSLDNIGINLNDLVMIKDLISDLHSLELQLEIFNPRQFLNFFKTRVSFLPFENIEQYDKEVDQIINEFYEDGSIVVSHNDLVPGNFLKQNGNIFLIDFEYTSMNHYLFDYASFMSESLAENPELQKGFFNLLNLNEKEIKKLNDLIFFQNILWCYWSQYMLENTNDNIFKEIIEIKKKNIKKSLL